MSERETLLARATELKLNLPEDISDEDLKAAVTKAEAGSNAPSKSAQKKPQPQKSAAKQPTQRKSTQQSKPEPMVVVVGPSEGRWRIGRHFTSEPVEIKASELSKDDMLALEGDARLIVSTR